MRPSKNENRAQSVARNPGEQPASCQVVRGGFSSRGGFSLIELLVAIVIIGILIGLLVPGVMTAYRRTQEYAIEQELNQLSLAIEAFKTKYGFYPPDFTGFSTVNDFIPFLNRIAPNHGESTAALNTWWTDIGLKLQAAGPQSSYVFWLSGLARNKQFPLTGGTGASLLAYNVGTIEREVFFDFKSERLRDPANPGIQVGSNNAPVATYSQFNGTCQPFVYFELKSLPQIQLSLLTPASFVNVATSDGDYKLFPYFKVKNISGTDYIDFYAGTSFQLLAPGMDSQFSDAKIVPRYNTPNLSTSVAPPRERDNLTNFSEGRLELITNQ